MMKLSVLLISILLLSSASAKADWLESTVWGLYRPNGKGQDVLASLGEVVDSDTQKIMGYVFDRPTRTIYMMENDGQPYLEVWDFPSICPIAGCPDSEEARVTMIPYQSNSFLGQVSFVQDDQAQLVRVVVGAEKLIEIDMKTANIVGGAITENANIEPRLLMDPAINCAAGITCTRSLAFGRLPQQNIQSTMFSYIHWKDGSVTRTPNAKLFKAQSDSDMGNNFIFSTEDALWAAIHK